MILKDEKGQGAAEYILLFGGIIVIVVVVLLAYQNYVHSTTFTASADMEDVRYSTSELI